MQFILSHLTTAFHAASASHLLMEEHMFVCNAISAIAKLCTVMLFPARLGMILTTFEWAAMELSWVSALAPRCAPAGRGGGALCLLHSQMERCSRCLGTCADAPSHQFQSV